MAIWMVRGIKNNYCIKIGVNYVYNSEVFQGVNKYDKF